MFEVSMEKDPALALLFAVFAAVMTALCINHYYFGHYQVLLVNLIAIAIYSFGSIFLYLNRNRAHSKHINIFILSAIALLMQYQLSLTPQLTMHWLYSYPLLTYFALPLRWAFALNTVFWITTLSQLLMVLDPLSSFKLTLVLIIIGLYSWCFAYLNAFKQQDLLRLAVTDYQSGAFNGRHLLDKLNQEIARSLVTKRALSLLAMTIDDYQQIIDIHGRDSSERLLKSFRIKLMSLLRAGDEIFHDGKGTFYILLPNCSREGVLILKERLMKNVEGIQWPEVGEVQIITGLSTLRSGEQGDSFLQRASEHIQQQQQTALKLLAFEH